MANVTQYHLVPNGSNIFFDIRDQFSLSRTRKRSVFVYGVVIFFVVFTLFIAFIPSSSSSTWYINIFNLNSTSSTTFTDQSYKSHFSSVFSHFFPDSSQNITNSQVPISNSSFSNSKNSTNTQVPQEKGEKHSNQSTTIPQISQSKENSTSGFGNLTKEGNGTEEEVVKSDLLPKKQSNNEGNGSETGEGKKQGKEEDNLVGLLVNCDLYDGEWVRDDSYPLYKPGSCELIDQQFSCFLNGRPDNDYHKLKWKPKGCTLPRLSGEQGLKFLRGKRLVFIGDSLNRNMWESLVCILRNSVENKERVFEAFGRHQFRTEASYSFVFKDYNFTVEFFLAPFLVQQWGVKDNKGETRETLRLDLMVRDNDRFKNADFLVFNTGHWWNHEKTSKGEDYYQEGNHVYKQLDVDEAFGKAITTWARWVDANVNPNKTHVLFRGLSPTHFSGQWNSGGHCDNETEPFRNETYLAPYPWKMQVLESGIKGMKTPVSYLNVTTMADYRKDGHPSVYRKRNGILKIQDCSHWCLPGVPDSWNELLFAEILRKQYIDTSQDNS